MNELVEGYDVIGDVHACATQLEVLLNKLGYREGATSAVHHHPQRQAIFVGDLIDPATSSFPCWRSSRRWSIRAAPE
jgi:hypothetical protein|nr:hypothetical protein [Mycolicibacterium goodii]